MILLLPEFPLATSELFGLILALFLIVHFCCYISILTKNRMHLLKPLIYFHSHNNSFWQAATLPFILRPPPNVCACVCKSKRLLAHKIGVWLQSEFMPLCEKFKSAFHAIQMKAEPVVIMNDKLKLLTAEADRTKRGNNWSPSMLWCAQLSYPQISIWLSECMWEQSA